MRLEDFYDDLTALVFLCCAILLISPYSDLVKFIGLNVLIVFWMAMVVLAAIAEK